MTNIEIAGKLQEHARELWKRHDNLFRVKSYRRAAEMVQRLERPVEELLHERGRGALEGVPGIGKKLAKVIECFVQTGGSANRN
jgi:DNA polymerase/3'-5' exonuclease PolX